MKKSLLWVPLLLATATVAAEDVKPDEPADKATAAKVAAAGKAESGAKSIAGMSILGNQEAPKSLVIVPWKSSEIGDSLGFSALLDDSRKPVDRDVFMRELGYYQIRTETP
jgi:hypothetical protein